MPFIEENDLLNLHKNIEKSQIINEGLLNQIKYKNQDIKKITVQRNILIGITVLFLIGVFAITSFTMGLTTSGTNQNNLLVSIDSLEVIKSRMDHLKSQNQELNQVKEFYLAKQLLEKETIYSVQVKSLIDKELRLISDALTNTLFVKNNPFYAYSVGTFETLEEAQKFRSQLVTIGFEDAFVASYQDGQRIQIEEPY